MNMTESKSTAFVSVELDEFVPTTADTESPIARIGLDNEHWENLINRLITWAQKPDMLANEGIEPLTHKAIAAAACLVVELKKIGAKCPDSVAPDPNGGIVLKSQTGAPDLAIVFHVWDDGTIDRCVFSGSRLVERSG
ncbi:MAG TPA: hypothetical protein VGY55_12255 [Pirellulales bacterium]|jgi:hypothetical protein|nr:hypothetical protein [Pirellulales bacterium]